MIDNDFVKVNYIDDVERALNSIYKPIRAKHLFDFYILIKARGLQEIKKTTCKSVYYKNISDLKKANIDFSQKMNIDYRDIQVQFNPFEAKEIL